MKGVVYIMANDNNTVLYAGVTSELRERVREHKEKAHPGSFSARYNIRKLVYYELFEGIGQAIKREKQIKAGSRKNKMGLITGRNPEWRELINDLED
jgi:putative endonuclease